MRIISLLLCLTALTASANNNIWHIKDTNLTSAWEEALQRGKKSGSFQIGYQIKTNLDNCQWFWYGSTNLRITGSISPTLQQQLDGKAADQTTSPSRPFSRADENKSQRDLALIFRFRTHAEKTYLVEVFERELNQPGTLSGPTYWLGQHELEASLNHVGRLYNKNREQRVAPDLIVLVAHHDLPATVDLLADVLSSEAPRAHREEAASALGYLSDSQALTLAVKIAKKDRATQVREEAVDAMEEIGTQRAMNHLIDLAAGAKSAQIRAAAVAALAAFKDDQAREAIYRSFRKDKHDEVVEEALEVIVEDYQDVATLIDVVKGKLRPSARGEAIEYFAENYPEQALPVLSEIIKGKGPARMRLTAVEALAYLPRDMALPLLLDLADNHRAPNLQRVAVEALGEFSGSVVVNRLKKLAFAARGELAEEALDSLANMEERAALDALVSLGEKHADEEIRDEALDIVREWVFEQ